MEKQRAALVLLLIICFTVGSVLEIGAVKASSDVTDVIASDTTWTKADSPYSLSGNVLVSNEVTLTIEEGVTVNLNNYFIRINGTLVASGSSADQIQFNDGQIIFTETSGDWNEQSDSGSVIENAVFNLASIFIGGSSPKIDSNFLNNGISITEDAAPIISNNTLAGVDPHGPLSEGISVYSVGESYIYGNTISNCLWGIAVYGGGVVTDNNISGCSSGIEILENNGTPIVQRNLITNNTLGIEIRETKVGSGNSTVQNNTITNNLVGISIVTQVDGEVETKILHNNIYANEIYNIKSEVPDDIEAANNWWGTTDNQAITETIYDSKNDSQLGTVNFVPFLSEQVPTIPEFPKWTVIPLVLVATLALTLYKKRLSKRTM